MHYVTSYTAILVLAQLIGPLGLLAAGEGAKYEEALIAAKGTFEQKQSEMASEMTESFEDAEKLISNGGGGIRLSAEEKVRMLEVLSAEQERFEASRALPLSIVMRKKSVEYLKANAISVAKLQKAYSKAITSAQKENPNAVPELLNERDEKCSPFVVMKWRYTWAPGRTNDYELLSDGTFADGKFTWALDGDRIVMKGRDFVNLKASIWTDTCALSMDGFSMDGKNHLGHQKYGTRVE